jgi:DNA-binding Xre family transcriptional regulator
MNTGKSLNVSLAMRDIKKNALAKQIGVTPHTVTNWSKGANIPADMLKRICEFLEMPVSEFIALGE